MRWRSRTKISKLVRSNVNWSNWLQISKDKSKIWSLKSMIYRINANILKEPGKISVNSHSQLTLCWERTNKSSDNGLNLANKNCKKMPNKILSFLYNK